MNHSFCIEFATDYSVNEALLLENIYFWCKKNEANETNYHDGRYWTYNSVKAFAVLFPYLSSKQISNALKSLETNGFIVSGNYNKSPYDRTKWYAVTEKADRYFDLSKKATSSAPKSKMGNPEKANEIAPEGEPIPDINTAINTDEKEIYIEKRPRKTTDQPKSKDEAHAFYAEKGYTFDFNAWWDYYESGNWHKANGKPVKNWKQTMTTWQRSSYSAPAKEEKPPMTKEQVDEYPTYIVELLRDDELDKSNPSQSLIKICEEVLAERRGNA